MPIGEMLQTLIGECMQVLKPITMTIPGDLLGVGMEDIIHIGAGTVAGAGVQVFHGVGADPSVGAGVALSAGEAHGDILLIGADIMIRSGAGIMVIHTGATEVATGVVITDLTEEAVQIMDSVIQV